MKIAIVYDAVYPYIKGGAEKRIYDVARILSKNHEVHLFGMKYWDGENTLKVGDIYLHGVCNSISLYNKKGGRSLVQPFYFSLYLLMALKKFDFDLIECQNFPYISCFICKIYSILKKRPLVITWLETFDKGIIGFIEKLSFKLTKYNLVLIDNFSDRLKDKMVIPAGIDLGRIGKIKKNKEKFDIIYAGRLIKDKNVGLLLKAIKDLNLKVAIIGDGPEKNKLIDLADELGLSNISFKGFLEEDKDVYSYMKSSKVLILPSIREGFGIVVLEALACGCKVITVNHKKNNAMRLVDDDFICDADVESLRNKIKFSLKNPYHSKINLEDYDLKIAAENIEKYYLRCVNET